MLINIFLNWVFIFGHLGAPTLGLLGAGWATLLTRLFMLVVLVIAVSKIHFADPAQRHAFFHGTFHRKGYRDLLGLGVPAGCQVILEAAAFTFAAIMMGWISEAALAAHQIAISIASTTFMVPLGLSFAVAIRVSHAVGSNDPLRARLCVRGSLLMTLAFMSLTAVLICAFPQPLVALFIHDPKVIVLAAHVLFIAGLFQIFDGTQVLCAGALRGLHDVKLPTVINFSGYWLFGLPLSYLLAFHFQLGAVGVWWGLLAGLGIVAGLLILRLKLLLPNIQT
jgi:MATE family multidrug resistance protein